MTRAQPLSTLAPELSTQSQSVIQVITDETSATMLVIEEESHKIPKLPLVIEKCYEIPKCPPAKEECCEIPKCVKPCEDPCANNYGWGWLGALILWFIIFAVLFWLIFYSLKPSFVLQTDSNQVDTAKVLLASVVSSLILVIVIWLIKAAVNRSY